MTTEEINQAISASGDAGSVSDGYHTFNELYEVRNLLFAALVNHGGFSSWKARANHDGQRWPGWFVAGIRPDPGEQITFHLPEKMWGYLETDEVYDVNPYYDGHSSSDVVKRLITL